MNSTDSDDIMPVAIVTTPSKLDDAARQARLLANCGVRAKPFTERLAATLWQADEAALLAQDREWRGLRGTK